MRPIVCMITPSVTREDMAALVARIANSARAGVSLVQIRQPDLDARTLADLVRRTVEAVSGLATRIIVNERLDVALAAGAHGVHLREDSMPGSRVRAMTPRGFVVGRSVHSADAARRTAKDGGADYLVFGTVFATASKPGVAPAGAAALSEAVGATPLPLLAVGGVTLDRLVPVARAGAAGIAAIGLFAHDDAATAVADVARLWPSS